MSVRDYDVMLYGVWTHTSCVLCGGRMVVDRLNLATFHRGKRGPVCYQCADQRVPLLVRAISAFNAVMDGRDGGEGEAAEVVDEPAPF